MFDPYLGQELLKSEKRRLEVFLGVFAVAFLVSLGIRIFYVEEVQNAFRSQDSFYALMATIIVMAILIYLPWKWIARLTKTGGQLNRTYYLYTMAVEVCVPALLLIGIAINEQSAYFVDSPAIFLYFILIIVSSLHLSFWYSTILGILVGLFYGVYTYWTTTAYGDDLGLPNFTYYVRAIIYVIAGICSGLVASELRTRLISTYQHLQEKREIEGLFNQQISRELVEVLKQKKDYAERLKATLVFLDIRDFTKKVQRLSPEEVNSFQNQFFSPIIQIINDHQGIVNQILGDGLMATFGVPETDHHHPYEAWKAVKSILEYVAGFHDKTMDDESIEIGVGMHYGEVLVGNIGTETRKQLSVSGRAVIIASRIEQFNKELNSTLLMSGDLYDLLVDEIEEVKSKASYKLKGLDEEITIVQIL